VTMSRCAWCVGGVFDKARSRRGQGEVSGGTAAVGQQPAGCRWMLVDAGGGRGARGVVERGGGGRGGYGWPDRAN
jgi:hypothetical protein